MAWQTRSLIPASAAVTASVDGTRTTFSGSLGEAVGSASTALSVAIALTLVGCGATESEPTPPDLIFESGTRLRARVFDDGVGTLEFRGWYDTDLDTDCSFLPAQDGRMRCLPENDWGTALTARHIVYLDAKCSVAARSLSIGRPIPKLVVGDPRTEDLCAEFGAAVPVYELGEAIAPPSVYHRDDFGECTPFNVNPSYELIHALGNEVTPDRFVAAKEIHEQRDSGLAARIFAAEDGARQVFGIYDQRRGQPCERALTDLHTLEGPCLPLRLADTDGKFADSACSVPSAITPALGPSGGLDPNCPPSLVADTVDCISTLLFQVGARALGGEYRQQGSDCVSDYLNSQSNWIYRRGAPVALEEFVWLNNERRGSGRFQVGYASTAGRLLIQNGLLYDKELEAYCVPFDCAGTWR